MKKLTLLLLAIILAITTAKSQFTKVGAGLTFGSGYKFNNETGVLADLHSSPFAGIFLTGIYEISLPIHISPSFTYFIPRKNTGGIVGAANEDTRVSEMMVDINGHYVFNSLDRFEFYGLAGLNITFTKIKWLDTTSSGTDNALGLNIGAGTYMKLTDQFDLYAEAKYIVSKYDQLVVNAGILINIDWLIKHENTGM
jgi:opacity protein-like surface antigen